jgi:hypothetical protein
VDASGNTYLVVADQAPASTIVFNLYVMDPSGNVISTKQLWQDSDQGFSLKWLGVVNSSSTKQLSIVFNWTDGQGYQVASTKQFSLSGTVEGTHTVDTDPEAVYLCGASLGSDGSTYVVFSSGAASPLATYIYAPSGGTTTGNDPNIRIGDASLLHGNWLVTGWDASNNASWGLYNTACQRIAGATYPSVDNGKDTYVYSLTPAEDAAGNIYLGVEVREYDDVLFEVVLANHFVKSFTPAGVLRWTSPSYQGEIYSIAVNPSGSNVYVVTNQNQYETLDSTGHRQSQITTTTSPIALPLIADATGVYYARTYFSDKTTSVIDRFQGGAKVWTGSYTTAAQFTGNSTFVASATNASPNLYLVTMEPASSSTYTAIVQRFVSGPALSVISGSNTVANSNGITLKVQLNAPAPSGGLLVKLTSDDGALRFSNNTTAFSLAIPAGSLYANITMTAGSVPFNHYVTIQGNQAGVIRAKAVTVTR